jgi:hypothetical protein
MGSFSLQSGCDKSKTLSLEKYAESAHGKGATPFLYKVRLIAEEEVIIRASHELSLIGVNEYAMFPELYRTCSWIKQLRNLTR